MQHNVVNFPAEIWIQIFYLTADEDIIIQDGLHTVLAELAWYKDGDEWKLRSPQEAMEMLQRSYPMEKVNLFLPRVRPVFCSYTLINRQSFLLVSVGGSWALNAFSYLRDPEKVNSLCAILDSSSSIATIVTSSYSWWIKKI
jgi:hypothetical protein